MIRVFITGLILMSVVLHSIVERPIIILVCSYNNIKFCEHNLNSIRKQKYSNYHVIYIDDCSTDDTAQAVEKYIERWNLEDKIFLIKNTIRRGAMYNHYMVTSYCPNNVILVTLDGDDWFPDDIHVLTRINEAYENPDVWMTYGQFQEYPSGRKGFCQKIPDNIDQLCAYRCCGWMTSHLRTYYAGLFKEIPVGYFIRNGSFLGSACDLAIMFALLELSGGRALFIDDICYIYNTMNSNSDFRVRAMEQLSNDYWVRCRTPLTPFTDYAWKISYNSDNCSMYNLHISTQGVSACSDYLATLSYTDMRHDQTHVWYMLSSQEENDAYQALSKRYNINCMPIHVSDDFKGELLTYLAALPPHSFVLLTSDGCAFKSSWSSTQCINMLIKTKAVSYSCSRGSDTKRDVVFAATKNSVPALVPLVNGFCAWKYSEACGSWHRPYGIGGVVVQASQLQSILADINGATPEQLLYNLSLLTADNLDDVGLCNLSAPCVYRE